MKIIFFILFLAGQVSVIFFVIKENNYSKIKAILIGIYLFLGMNIPIALHDYIVIKAQNHIPFISQGMALYKYGLILIGLTGIVMPIYKTIKKQFVPKIEEK